VDGVPDDPGPDAWRRAKSMAAGGMRLAAAGRASRSLHRSSIWYLLYAETLCYILLLRL